MGGPVASKLDFDRSHKFSIVCENTAHSGYTTEKLVEAFAAGCIPIYWGDPDHGIPAGTPFEKLPADWKCPRCRQPKSKFNPA